MPEYILLEYGKIGNEFQDVTVHDEIFVYTGYKHIGFDDAAEELKRMDE